MLGSLILYLKGMRTAMFQLSGFYRIVITTNTVHLILTVSDSGFRVGQERRALRRRVQDGFLTLEHNSS